VAIRNARVSQNSGRPAQPSHLDVLATMNLIILAIEPTDRSPLCGCESSPIHGPTTDRSPLRGCGFIPIQDGKRPLWIRGRLCLDTLLARFQRGIGHFSPPLQQKRRLLVYWDGTRSGANTRTRGVRGRREYANARRAHELYNLTYITQFR
jgi:hypothetical protein